jgi:HAE1 family hydrophobic/amphiphilic exporter-1
MVSGVAGSGVRRKVRCAHQLDPKELASQGIGINRVDAVSQANVNLPTGTLYGAQQAFTVQASGQLTRLNPTARCVTTATVAPCGWGHLRGHDSVENNKVAAWYINQRSIILAVAAGDQHRGGGRAVRNFAGHQAKLPASVSMHILYDASVSIGSRSTT